MHSNAYISESNMKKCIRFGDVSVEKCVKGKTKCKHIQINLWVNFDDVWGVFSTMKRYINFMKQTNIHKLTWKCRELGLRLEMWQTKIDRFAHPEDGQSSKSKWGEWKERVANGKKTLLEKNCKAWNILDRFLKSKPVFYSTVGCFAPMDDETCPSAVTQQI